VGQRPWLGKQGLQLLKPKAESFLAFVRQNKVKHLLNFSSAYSANSLNHRFSLKLKILFFVSTSTNSQVISLSVP